MRSGIAALAVGVLLALSADAGAATATNSWPMTGYNAARSNLNPMETTLTSTSLSGLRHQRTITYPAPSEECGSVGSAPVVSGTTLFAVLGTDLVAIDLVTGRRLWSSQLDALNITIYTALVVKAGRVYVAGLDCVSQSDPNGAFWLLDAASGAPIAHPGVPSSARPIESLVVSGARIVISGRNVNDGTAYFDAYDTATLTRVWGIDTCAPDPLIVVRGGVIATCPTDGTPKTMASYYLGDGHRLWSKPGNWRPMRGDTDAGHATALYAANPAGLLTAVNPLTGAVIWTSSQERGPALAVGKKRLYVTCDGTALCALNRTTGARLWKKPAGAGGAVTSVVIAGDVVYPSPATWPVLASTGANVVLPVAYPGRDGSGIIIASGMLVATNLTAGTIDIYGL